MDFATRDRYRHAIEEISLKTNYSEIEIARRTTERATAARSRSPNGSKEESERRSDPGYYLISEGRLPFERELGFRVSLRHKLLRLYVRGAVPGYLGSIALLTAAIL